MQPGDRRPVSVRGWLAARSEVTARRGRRDADAAIPSYRAYTVARPPTTNRRKPSPFPTTAARACPPQPAPWPATTGGSASARTEGVLPEQGESGAVRPIYRRRRRRRRVPPPPPSPNTANCQPAWSLSATIVWYSATAGCCPNPSSPIDGTPTSALNPKVK